MLRSRFALRSSSDNVNRPLSFDFVRDKHERLFRDDQSSARYDQQRRLRSLDLIDVLIQFIIKTLFYFFLRDQ